jgi:hypothetical protein
MTCIFPPYLLLLFCFAILLFLTFFHLSLRVCLPISDPVPSDHSASPSSQAYLISHILSHFHVYIPFQELPITHQMSDNTPDSTTFSLLILIPYPPQPLPSPAFTPSEHRPAPIAKTTGLSFYQWMAGCRLSPMRTHTLVLLYLTIRRLSVSFSFPFWSLFLSSTPWHPPLSKHLTIRVYCFFSFTHSTP